MKNACLGSINNRKLIEILGSRCIAGYLHGTTNRLLVICLSILIWIAAEMAV